MLSTLLALLVRWCEEESVVVAAAMASSGAFLAVRDGEAVADVDVDVGAVEGLGKTAWISGLRVRKVKGVAMILLSWVIFLDGARAFSGGFVI